jgi:hypothetical protein
MSFTQNMYVSSGPYGIGTFYGQCQSTIACVKVEYFLSLFELILGFW